MSRWNVSNIFFFGVSGEIREIALRPGEVNVITGASGTGKSTLIKALDYCLGSSNCELPAFVRRRCTAVGVKWVNGDEEMIVARLVPPVGIKTSTRMFASTGRALATPTRVEDLEGPGSAEAVRQYIERAFGIGDMAEAKKRGGAASNRVSIRQATPFLFVTKEVIYSETVLLHGLDNKEKADQIVAALPYFLRVSSEETAAAERRLRQLRKALEIEEERERARSSSTSLLSQRANVLLEEGRRLGLPIPHPQDGSERALISALQDTLLSEQEATTYPGEGELAVLHDRRKNVLSDLNRVKREFQAASLAVREAQGFGGAVEKQRQKLLIASHLGLDEMSLSCPICDSKTEAGVTTAQALKASIEKIRAESSVVERVRPRVVEHANALDERSRSLGDQLRAIDAEIRSAVGQIEAGQRLADLAQAHSYYRGKVSYFLESLSDVASRPVRDLEGLRSEVRELETKLDREAREVRTRRAEAAVSKFATEIFAALPKVAPCTNAELEFSSKRPSISVIEDDVGGAVLSMADIGSDQNYLAVHVALSFALQRYFELVRAPVPGLLVLDQISRPYYPANDDDADEQLVYGEDDDALAMRRHVDFLFAEVAARSGLQVLLIEHAYFADDPRFVAATRERWTKASGRALIPASWSVRPDAT